MSDTIPARADWDATDRYSYALGAVVHLVMGLVEQLPENDRPRFLRSVESSARRRAEDLEPVEVPA